MKSKEISDLLKMGEVGFSISQTRFAEIARKEESIRSQLLELENARILGQHTNAIGAEKLVGADLLWSKWIEARKRLLNEALALVLAQKISAQANLKKAFGRREALIQISDKAALDRKTAARRRNN